MSVQNMRLLKPNGRVPTCLNLSPKSCKMSKKLRFLVIIPFSYHRLAYDRRLPLGTSIHWRGNARRNLYVHRKMIKPNETSGSFSSSGTSDTLAESNKDSLTTLFSSLFAADTRADSRDLNLNLNQKDSRDNLLPLTCLPTVPDISETSRKNTRNLFNCELVHATTNADQKSCDILRSVTVTVPESSVRSANDASSLPAPAPALALALSSDTAVVSADRNKGPPPPPSCSKVPVSVLTSSRANQVNAEEEEATSNWDSGTRKLVDACTLRRVCSSSRIPVSTKRILRTETTRKGNLFFSSTRSCLQRLDARESSLKRPPGNHNSSSHHHHHHSNNNNNNNNNTTSKKYVHIKSKVAAYIRRPANRVATATAAAAAAAATTMTMTTRSMSPNDSSSSSSRIRNDDNIYASGDGIKRPSSRTSLETTYACGCENKMPSADVSIDLGKFENSSDSVGRIIGKHIESALEHNRRKLEKERIIAGHQRDIAKQRQLVLEHGERAHDCLQKAMILLLDKK